MKVKDAAWKRVAGGVCGFVMFVSVRLLLGQHGVSDEEVLRGEEAVAFSVAAAVAVLWFVKRRGRRSP